MKNDRLFQLLYMLLEKGRMTAPELAKTLEVSVRTVYRDVETLSMAGVPVCTEAGRGGGVSLMEGCRFDKALLSDAEQNQLLFAVQSLRVADQPVEALLAKLGGAFQKPVQDWIMVDFSRWGQHAVDSERFDMMKNAILERQTLRLVYCGTSGELTRRSIRPLRLVYKDKHWYLQAYCLRAEDFRLFKVSRILELEPAGEHFGREYEGKIPPIETALPPGAAVVLKLKISQRLAYRAYDEFDRGRVTPQPDGTLLAEAEFPMDGWVLGYLFSFGSDVEVLEPLELRSQLAVYAEKIAAHHKP